MDKNVWQLAPLIYQDWLHKTSGRKMYKFYNLIFADLSRNIRLHQLLHGGHGPGLGLARHPHHAGPGDPGWDLRTLLCTSFKRRSFLFISLISDLPQLIIKSELVSCIIFVTSCRSGMVSCNWITCNWMGFDTIIADLS